MKVLRAHADGTPRVYRASFVDASGATVFGVVKAETDPEAFWNEFEVYYTLCVGQFFAPVLGHVVGGVFRRGLPVLQSCEETCPTARDLFGSRCCFTPEPGLCPIVLQDCGPTLAELRPRLRRERRLKLAAQLVDSLREMRDRNVYVTDLKLENVCTSETGVVFIDPGSVACGKATPVTSFVLLANWLRTLVPRLPSLQAAMRLFAAAHPRAARDRCIEATAGEVVGLSAKIALAQLLDFEDTAIVFYQSIDFIFSNAQNQVRVCVGHRESDYRDFVHIYCSGDHLVV
jgi:hypothetical protein